MIWLRRLALGLTGLVLSGLCLDRLFPPPLEAGQTVSRLVTDRHARPLRAFPLPDGRWRFAADLEALDPVFVDALLAVEDQRFWHHGGVDWIGLVRAAWTSALAGDIVSGGSTITMQTARLLEPRRRTVGAKLIEMIRAHQIEWRLSKTEILELYLTLAPYGGPVEGVRAASWRYFGRAPDRLTDDQIALLIALPQAPEARRPDLRPHGARSGRDLIAAKLARLGYFSDRRAADVRAQPVFSDRTAFPAGAWHASATALGNARSDVRSTLDGALQADLEGLALRVAEAQGPQTQVSILVVETRTRQVRAAIGSASRQRAGGWLDLTAQVRSPGSTLKPFIYAMAFDDGAARPATRIADLPKRFSAYQPENFDRSFRGDVSVAQALQHSLNIPAVLVLDRIGADRFSAALRLAGAPPRLVGGAESRPGLALALGGAGLTAQELAVLYAALGDGGVARPLVWTEAAPAPDPGHRLMSAQAAGDIVDILRGTPAPAGRMPGQLAAGAPQIAFKTGTSYGFRDAWAAGLSGGHVIIVWTGRADGAPRPGQTGRVAALPALFDVADRVEAHLGGVPEPDLRAGRPSAPTGEVGGALVAFGGSEAPPDILFPPDRAELWAGPVNGRPGRGFAFAGRGSGELNWFVDGRAVAPDGGGVPVWTPARNGFYTVAAVDPAGRSRSVEVRVTGLD